MTDWQGEGAAVFRETKAAWGILSNMAPSPLVVNGIRFRTSEALYQVCRFPDHPNIQQSIIDAKSPMTAKMITKPWKHLTRPDWQQARVEVMRWALAVKWQQCPDFWAVLVSSQGRQIIESSSRDDFWGAIPTFENPNLLRGTNTLGALLMALRDTPPQSERIAPPALPNFLLLGEPIGPVEAPKDDLREQGLLL